MKKKKLKLCYQKYILKEKNDSINLYLASLLQTNLKKILNFDFLKFYL